MKKIEVMKPILGANEELAAANEARLADEKVYMVNLMASPGAGKTSTIMRTIEGLKGGIDLAVIEGDIASRVDADKISKEHGIPVVQVNTGGSCHLDANMVARALDQLPLDEVDAVICENVGNLVCPVEFSLGEDSKVMILSVAEGHDKPYKYPLIFKESDALILNKTDLMPYTDFDMDEFTQVVRGLNPGIALFPVSCRNGEGFSEWLAWLEERVKAKATA